MPATRRRMSNNSPPMEPYSLKGVPKAQSAALTVAMLRSHLKHFNLSTQGKKQFWLIVLVSLEDNVPNPPPPNPPQEASTLLPHLLDHLTAILHQDNNTQGVTFSSTVMENRQETTEDDCLSAASELLLQLK